MANTPALSVIVPVYGVEQYLHECMDSILNQSFRDLEVILIDDGGTDSCPQICDDYAKKDERVRVIHKQNGGYGHTCNVGLEMARGEYVSIIEPDDFIAPNMYEELYENARLYNSDVVKSAYNDYLDYRQDKKIHRINWRLSRFEGRSFTIQECPILLFHHPSIWTCLYRREFLENHHIRFVEAPGSGWTDAPFQVQTLCLAERISYVDKAYYHWRVFQSDYAGKLKDWTIPFSRCDEIHQWLQKQGITDKEILSCLAMREIRYTGTAIRSASFSQLSTLKPYVQQMLNRIDLQALQESRWLIPSYLKNYKLYKRHIFKARYISQFELLKQIRRFICCIRLSKRQCCIQLLGVQFAIGEPIKPSLLVVKLWHM